MRIFSFIGLLGALFLLAACGPDSPAPTENETAPPAEDKPTFIFFFTDN